MRSFLPFLALVAVCQVGQAQVSSDVGLTILIPNQRFGSICTPFTCQPTPVGLASGTSFYVQTWGDFGSPYVVMVSATANTCTPIPPFHHSLALGAPLFQLGAGVITSRLNGLCVGGIGGFTVNLPIGVKGATFGLQAIAMSPVGFSFTNAMRMTAL